MIRLHLTQIDALESAIASIEARIEDALGPFGAAGSLLTTMPGLSERRPTSSLPKSART